LHHIFAVKYAQVVLAHRPGDFGRKKLGFGFSQPLFGANAKASLKILAPYVSGGMVRL
jgi:hypothetical protein